ncbi:MAG: nucleotidyltransferase family protein [Sphaerochaeta sp.]|jgi:molybdenum cofactor cytidylyltransferase|uniref:nucleotidyltransferase family protein n=1 Tax=Sphaerochaeta sp. TaxID=1972642 RepID=UPI002FCA15A9
MQNLLLAAGLGTRSAGKKLLLPYQNSTIIHHATEQSLLAGLSTVVVTGFRSEAVEDAIKDLACPALKVVRNVDYTLGQGSSTLIGARHLAAGESFFISLADMPLIEARHYRLLLEQIDKPLARPCFHHALGHPVYLDAAFLALIKAQKPPFAMHSLLKDYEIQLIHVDDQAYILDIDTLADYQALLQNREDHL